MHISPVAFKEYEAKSKEAGEAYDRARQEYDRIMEEYEFRTQKVFIIRQFIDDLKTQKGVVKEYDFDLMKRTVEKIIIYHDGQAEFEFLNGVKPSVRG